MRTGSFLDFGGPHYESGLIDANGRMTRLCKGGNQDAAIAEQRAARAQSAGQFKIQMQMMAAQAKAAAQVKVPVIRPADPPAQTSDATIEAARDQKRQAGRRFGFASARMAGSNSLGSQPVLGGGYQLGQAAA